METSWLAERQPIWKYRPRETNAGTDKMFRHAKGFD
jgi:hypothetical protein